MAALMAEAYGNFTVGASCGISNDPGGAKSSRMRAELRIGGHIFSFAH
jgi:hypothetical protein